MLAVRIVSSLGCTLHSVGCKLSYSVRCIFYIPFKIAHDLPPVLRCMVCLHVTNLCSRVNKQLQVIKRFRKLITGQTRLKLHNAFIQPVFRYCSDVWAFCSARNRDKLEQLNRQILNVYVVLSDSPSS